MARTALTVQEPAITGTVLTMTEVPGTGTNNGVSFTNDGNTILLVINGGAGASVPTIDATAAPSGVSYTDPTGSVTNDSVPEIYGPFRRDIFGGTVGVDFSVATGVDVAAVRVPRS